MQGEYQMEVITKGVHNVKMPYSRHCATTRMDVILMYFIIRTFLFLNRYFNYV